MSSRSLILNASHEPLGVVTLRRAVMLVIRNKAEVLEHNGLYLKTTTLDMAAPSVIRLNYYVRIPHRVMQSPNRRGVFLRDGGRCQYCGRTAENVDHVVPRSRGGAHTWDNVVACCKRCNGRKENRMPHEIGLHPKRVPTTPPSGFWLLMQVGRAEPEWEIYLPLELRASA